MADGRVLLLLLAVAVLAGATNPPNILFFAADDVGWNDIGWNNPDIKTPNLDHYAKNGIILNQSYVQPLCSPSRSAWLSGRFPYHTGMQHLVILPAQPYGLPLNLTTLPNLMKDAGYATHMVGKWHQGFCNWDYTPTHRGFDSFFGYYNAQIDYYSHKVDIPLFGNGIDFRDNEKAVTNQNGTYSTGLYTKRAQQIITEHNKTKPLFLYFASQNVHMPLEVPQSYIDMYSNIKNKNRRLTSAMVTAMDDSFGAVVNTLEEQGMMDNTLIVFTSDNGGPVYAGGNNWPLRGSKATMWEGGTRAAAYVYGSMLKKAQFSYHGMMHAVDWFPTMAEIAGAKLPIYELDGMSMWNAIRNNATSPRTEFVYNMNVKGHRRGRAAIRVNDWKLVVGPDGLFSGWYPVPTSSSHNPTDFDLYHAMMASEEDEELGTNEIDSVFTMEQDARATKYQLFNVIDDPTEHHDLSKEQPDVLKMMIGRYSELAKTEVKAMNPNNDPKANPKYYNGVWTPGWC
ncbi:arylsulfatase B-like isoform X1 [Lineus longissimus]|uniref:arylsulfatase B-like isoform X1 n=1 Tax=Lineus longissimus TaxID=88925 RepID=UPI002B4C87EA